MSSHELDIIRKIIDLKRKAPFQLNKAFETDTELIRVRDTTISVTIDSITEELKGLVKNPYTMGWLCVLSSLSDTAASGAVPLGILLACNISYDKGDDFIGSLFLGAEECAASHNTYILGGDTNQSSELSLTSMCIGLVENGKFSKRSGFKTGDKIYTTGTVGRGNLLAYMNLTGNSDARRFEEDFKPRACLDFGKAAACRASACIDSSDGLIHSLFALYDQGEHGFEINLDSTPYCKDIVRICGDTNIPPFIFALGEVGDYELIFTVSGKTDNELQAIAEKTGMNITCIGEVVEERGFFVMTQGYVKRLNIDEIRNQLSVNSHQEYLKSLLAITNTILGELL
jgi:thiamine-monophosphate kinase